MTEAAKSETPVTDTVREAVGVFEHANALESAVDELLGAGFDRAEISLLASEEAVVDKLGHVYEKVGELEDDRAVPRAAYVERDSRIEEYTGIIGGLAYVGALAAVGTVVASGGTLAAAMVGAALAGGGGGVLGSLVVGWLSQQQTEHIAEQLKKGGLLLWVGLRDPAHEKKAVDILNRHSAADVHVHAVPKAELPEKNPLTGVNIDPFLPEAPI